MRQREVDKDLGRTPSSAEVAKAVGEMKNVRHKEVQVLFQRC